MRTLLISYDLRAPGRNYDPLWAYLESSGSWAKPLESLYLVRTIATPAQVRNTIVTQYLDRNDRVMVIDVTDDHSAWSISLDPGVIKWIGPNL